MCLGSLSPGQDGVFCWELLSLRLKAFAELMRVVKQLALAVALPSTCYE